MWRLRRREGFLWMSCFITEKRTDQTRNWLRLFPIQRPRKLLGSATKVLEIVATEANERSALKVEVAIASINHSVRCSAEDILWADVMYRIWTLFVLLCGRKELIFRRIIIHIARCDLSWRAKNWGKLDFFTDLEKWRPIMWLHASESSEYWTLILTRKENLVWKSSYRKRVMGKLYYSTSGSAGSTRASQFL